jgi:hypothetical protein
MGFYFENHTTINYDLKKNNKYEVLTNILLRYKITEIIKRTKSVYFDYSIPENIRPDAVAYKIYKDSTLDWLIFIINDIYDPLYDWPLSYENFNSYLKAKYGSVEYTLTNTHHYEKIITPHAVLFDGTIVPERTLEVDLTTYNQTPASERKSITYFAYEQALNENKRNIKLIDESYIPRIMSSIEEALEENE